MDERQGDGGEHVGEGLDVFGLPSGVGVADDLGGASPFGCSPGGLEGSVGVGVALEIVAVGVEDVDGVLGVTMVAGDGPEEGLEVCG